MDEGLEVGRRARGLYPHGILVSDPDVEWAAQQTQQLLANPATSTIFEATFCPGPYVAKADILIRRPPGWQLIEVKSGTKPGREYVEDLAYTAAVLRHSAVDIVAAELMTVSPSYRLGKPVKELFAYHDCTDEAVALVEQYHAVWEQVANAVLAEGRPCPSFNYSCRDCEYFDTQCLGQEITHPIFDLPRLGQHVFAQLNSQRIRSIREIPDSSSLNVRQAAVRRAVLRGIPEVNGSRLASLLAEVAWPAAYLDFETVVTCLPVFPRVAPFEQVVTQYSLHICDRLGRDVKHHEYLAEGARDCRQDLLASLLGHLEEAKSIIVYSSFEKTVLGGLERLYPEHSQRIQSCIGRLFDLEDVFKIAFVHPDFRGKTSIKKTLPVLVDLSYDDLQIKNGDAAIGMFARLARETLTPSEVQSIRQALREYCKRDTWAMVKLHEKVVNYCVEQQLIPPGNYGV